MRVVNVFRLMQPLKIDVFYIHLYIDFKMEYDGSGEYLSFSPNISQMTSKERQKNEPLPSGQGLKNIII